MIFNDGLFGDRELLELAASCSGGELTPAMIEATLEHTRLQFSAPSGQFLLRMLASVTQSGDGSNPCLDPLPHRQQSGLSLRLAPLELGDLGLQRHIRKLSPLVFVAREAAPDLHLLLLEVIDPGAFLSPSSSMFGSLPARFHLHPQPAPVF